MRSSHLSLILILFSLNACNLTDGPNAGLEGKTFELSEARIVQPSEDRTYDLLERWRSTRFGAFTRITGGRISFLEGNQFSLFLDSEVDYHCEAHRPDCISRWQSSPIELTGEYVQNGYIVEFNGAGGVSFAGMISSWKSDSHTITIRAFSPVVFDLLGDGHRRPTALVFTIDGRAPSFDYPVTSASPRDELWKLESVIEMQCDFRGDEPCERTESSLPFTIGFSSQGPVLLDEVRIQLSDDSYSITARVDQRDFASITGRLNTSGSVLHFDPAGPNEMAARITGDYMDIWFGRLHYGANNRTFTNLSGRYKKQ